MPSLQLYPKLPQELRNKILAYVIKDESVTASIIAQGNNITAVHFIYNPALKVLMDDEEMRDQLQHLVYEHAILDLSRSRSLWEKNWKKLMSHELLKTKLRHFRKITLRPYLSERNTGELFDQVNHLRFLGNPYQPIEEGGYAVKMARATKMHFRLTKEAVVEVVVDWEGGSQRPPFKVIPDAALDREAMEWYGLEELARAFKTQGFGKTGFAFVGRTND